jgi:hypothetical protein
VVEIVNIHALLETGDASVLKERDYDKDPIIKVSRHVYKTALTGRSVLITKKGDKEGRSAIPIV